MESEEPLLSEIIDDQNQEADRDLKKSTVAGACDVCSIIRTVLKEVNALAGVELLSIPFIIKEAGWMSLVVCALYACLSYYTIVLVQWCSEEKEEEMSFLNIGKVAYGRYGRILFSLVWYLELYFHCVGFIISEGDHLTKIFSEGGGDSEGVHLESLYFFVILTTLVGLPTVELEDLHVISYQSGIGVLATVLVILSVFYVGIVDGVGFHLSGSLVNWRQIPFAIGAYGSCYSGRSVIPNIDHSTSDKEKFKKALVVSFLSATAIYLIFGSFGYLLFGQDTQSQITLNFPKRSIASKVAIWANVNKPFARYSLFMNAIVKSLVPSVTSNKFWRLFLGTALVISTVLVAFLLPSFDLVRSSISCIFSILVAVFFFKIAGKKAKASQVVISVLVIFFSIVRAYFETFFT